MSISFSETKGKIIRVLGDIVATKTADTDPTQGQTFTADLLKDSVHAALDAITVRRFKPAELEVAGGAISEELPEDVIDIEAVFDKTEGIFLEKIVMTVGQSLTPRAGNGWFISPSNQLSFANALGISGATIYYSAYWTKPVDEEEYIEAPDITITALTMYAASYCLLNSAAQASSIRQFATKVDSGKPTDNPLEQSSTYFMRRFEIELQRIPPSQKGITV
jgi:hypothetical protein